MSFVEKNRENKLLARVTFITSLGDFLSYFAVLVMIHDLSQNIATAAYSVAVKTIAIALGGAAFPYVSSRVSFRTVMILTQGVSGVLMALLAWLGGLGHGQSFVSIIFGILFCQSFLKQLFEAAREARSRNLGALHQQRTLQAEILHSFYGSQFWGPILSFLLIRKLPLTVPLWLDAVSFLWAAAMALRVSGDYLPVRYKLFAPFGYFWSNKDLRDIFWIRSIGMWIPIGLFNYMLFPVVQQHYGLELINSVWVYVAVGLGSVMATYILKSRWVWVQRLEDWQIAVFGFALLALTRLAFIRIPSFGVGLLAIVLGGICNGANATATQSIRMRVTSVEQLPEVMGLEIFIGRIADWLVSTACLFLLKSQIISYKNGIYVSSACLFLLSIFLFGSRTGNELSVVKEESL